LDTHVGASQVPIKSGHLRKIPLIWEGKQRVTTGKQRVTTGKQRVKQESKE
jgi:hypothetical protein